MSYRPRNLRGRRPEGRRHEYGSHRVERDVQRDARARRSAPVLEGDTEADRDVRSSTETQPQLVPRTECRHCCACRGNTCPGRARGQRESRRRRRRRGRQTCRPDRTGCTSRSRSGTVDPVALGQHRRRPDPASAHHRLRSRPEDAHRVLHQNSNRSTGQPSQQRRHRRSATPCPEWSAIWSPW